MRQPMTTWRVTRTLFYLRKRVVTKSPACRYTHIHMHITHDQSGCACGGCYKNITNILMKWKIILLRTPLREITVGSWKKYFESYLEVGGVRPPKG